MNLSNLKSILIFLGNYPYPNLVNQHHIKFAFPLNILMLHYESIKHFHLCSFYAFKLAFLPPKEFPKYKPHVAFKFLKVIVIKNENLIIKVC